MKMKLLFFISTILISSLSYAQNLIAVESGATTTFYNNIDSAVASAVDNDIIYLPGGSFTPSSGVLVIDKNLDFIGTGHYPDSTIATGQTIINGNINIRSTAAGGSIQGLYITGSVNFGTNATNGIIDGFSISRCYIASFLSLAFDNAALNPTTQNINISENVILGISHFAYAKNVNASKNIFQEYIKSTNGQIIFSNNIFLREAQGGCFSTPTFHDLNGAMFYNNIVCNTGCSGIYAGAFTGNTFYNNMFFQAVTFPINGNPGVGNIINQSINDVFISHTIQNFNYANNYKLKIGCAGINAGSDATDIGLYGTAFPYKPSAVPMNPHISTKSIAPQTNASGNLNINIKVAAQEN